MKSDGCKVGQSEVSVVEKIDFCVLLVFWVFGFL